MGAKRRKTPGKHGIPLGISCSQGDAVDLPSRWTANRKRQGSRGRGRGSRSGARRWRGWLAPWRATFRVVELSCRVIPSVSNDSCGLMRAGEGGAEAPALGGGRVRCRYLTALPMRAPCTQEGASQALPGTTRNGRREAFDPDKHLAQSCNYRGTGVVGPDDGEGTLMHAGRSEDDWR